ncbi:RNA polymerase sigma factor [Microtetraspora sp. AC03309]|uniref:RNA polymerase sigma factor n=1 Tax=Microtetraspora sp. AC03309 TaxID=2779376 RepID=UPI00272DFE40|nr:sigma-70 family RNA polymerase sigma factor [Microtetraspora sp. AC03309]
MTDELLVVRCQLGERAAFTELVAAWHVPVWTYVRRMLDAERADDVAQEIWLAVIRGLPRLRDPGRFAPWLFTIARRAVTDRLREEYARAEAPTGAGVAVLLAGRTHLAFTALTAFCLAWAGYGAWAITRRAPLFALDRVIAAWLATTASTVMTVVLAVAAVQRGTGLVPSLVTGAVLVVIAIVLAVRAHAHRAALLRRKRELTGGE